MSEFARPSYEFTRNTFLEIVRERVFETQFRNDSIIGGFCFLDQTNSYLDRKGQVQFFVSLSNQDALRTQAESLVHEALHIDLHDGFQEDILDERNQIQLRSAKERLVREQTEKFMRNNSNTAKGAVNYLRIKNGRGFQIPLKLDLKD
jgi:hypothetical protein